MTYDVTLITGDGIGPEIANATRSCIDATGADINWHIKEAGIDIYNKCGDPLPKDVIDSIRKTKVAIKAPITTPVGKGFRSVNVRLRKELDLYACLRPCKSYQGVNSRYDDIDLVIVRENTEDLYAGIEFEEGKKETSDLIEKIHSLTGNKIAMDSGISIKPISIRRSERIVRFAFDYALENARKKVTAVHKANIMKYSDGLFLSVARRVAEEYPEVEFEDYIVDNMCMQLVQKPQLYDVLVLPNLYGDILSDLCAGLVGGLGVAPGGNIGKDMAVFEATHGSAPKYAKKNVANPTALILSGVMMLHHLGEKEAADKLEKAVASVIAKKKDVTFDLKEDRNDPTAVGTQEMAHAIIKKMR
ncbi:MAG: isocitrate/isopropylmalate dehydrogenase family protein [Candidatus Methanofastidiosia archaeon]